MKKLHGDKINFPRFVRLNMAPGTTHRSPRDLDHLDYGTIGEPKPKRMGAPMAENILATETGGFPHN
jgi:hypothetical protein